MKIVFNTQYIYSLIVSYMLSFLALLNLGNEIFNLIGLQTQLDTILLYAALFIMQLLGFAFTIKGLRQFRLDVLLVVAFFGVSFFVSALIYPSNFEYMFSSWDDYAGNPLYVFFLYTLPGFVFARQLDRYDYLYSIMKVFSYIVVLMSVVVFFFAQGSSAMQYMTFSYNMIVQLFFLILYKPKRLKYLHYIIVGFGIFVFIFGGARGALLSLIIACILYYLFTHEINFKNVIGCGLILTVGLIFNLFKNGIMILISNVLSSMSIDSRNFQFLISGEIFADRNRTVLYESSLKHITLLGKGIMGDRVLLNSYPHNIFLEILVQYGYILGIALVLIIGFLVVFALVNKSTPEFVFIILILPCGLFKLLLTGSYLNQEPAFYILMGLCVNAILRSRNYANTNVKHSIRSW